MKEKFYTLYIGAYEDYEYLVFNSLDSAKDLLKAILYNPEYAGTFNFVLNLSTICLSECVFNKDGVLKKTRTLLSGDESQVRALLS